MSEWHHRQSQHLHSIPVHRAGRRQVTRRQVFALIGLTLAIVAVVVATIWRSGPASSVLPVEVTRSAGVPKPTTTPGTQMPRTTAKKPPPIATAMPNDGTYLVGRHIKAGTYTAPGPDTGRCYWARLRDTSGEQRAVIAASYKPGRQIVTIRKGDGAFNTDGCGPWELMKP